MLLPSTYLSWQQLLKTMWKLMLEENSRFWLNQISNFGRLVQMFKFCLPPIWEVPSPIQGNYRTSHMYQIRCFHPSPTDMYLFAGYSAQKKEGLSFFDSAERKICWRRKSCLFYLSKNSLDITWSGSDHCELSRSNSRQSRRSKLKFHQIYGKNEPWVWDLQDQMFQVHVEGRKF